MYSPHLLAQTARAWLLAFKGLGLDQFGTVTGRHVVDQQQSAECTPAERDKLSVCIHMQDLQSFRTQITSVFAVKLLLSRIRCVVGVSGLRFLNDAFITCYMSSRLRNAGTFLMLSSMHDLDFSSASVPNLTTLSSRSQLLEHTIDSPPKFQC
jgi:hypothetical protein